MAPTAGNKRKRGDRTWSSESLNEGSRPSPHRPGNLNLAQQQHNGNGRENPEGRGRGGRRSGRGNRNQRRPSDGPNAQQRETPTPAKILSPQTVAEPEQARPNGTPSAPIQTPIITQPSTAKMQRSSYCYDYLTIDRLDAWVTTGRQAVIEIGVKARCEKDTIVLASLFQEFYQAAIEGRLHPSDAGNMVKNVIGDIPTSAGSEAGLDSVATDACSIFLDTLSILTEADASHPNLRPFVFSTEIPSSLMRLQLETPLLQSLGLIRDTFARMGIRKQTNLLYRQSNYNLLREESEGYSKLLTELFTTSNNEPPSSDVIEDTFERVKAMIGAFDMDVGRVLDVTLDVFAAVLVKQYRFCVKFLRVSSWWPAEDDSKGHISASGLPKWALPGSPGWSTTDEERAEMLLSNEQRDRAFWKRAGEIGTRAFFEIGRGVLSESERQKLLSTSDSDAIDENDETRKWIEQTGTLPPKGNKVAAQLLGFKLRFYSSNARNASDVLPDNLIYLAALLIKVGFISLRDLYPHLWRPDESMEELKVEKNKEKAEREKAARHGGGTMNALLMAGALADDTLPPPRNREAEIRASTPARDQERGKSAPPKQEDKEQLPEPADQKVLLLKSLLAIGALPESLYILGKFPWLMDVYPELPEYIHRILHHCLSKVYDATRPLASRNELRARKKVVNSEQGSVASGTVRLGERAPRRVLRWALLDKEDTNDGTDYRFYWDDWADNIPICQSVDDVFALCGSLLNLSGVKIGADPSLLVKIARIGKDSLKSDSSESNRNRWQDLCKRLLVPSLSLTKVNPGVVNEVFELLGEFSQETRYLIYAEWYSGQTSRLPDIKAAFDQAKAETKDALKRLSKTNLRPMARTLAKIAYANPGIVINVAINQIESYENLIEVVVECARYFTYLGYDILTWSLINSLGQNGRSRLQESGLLTSRWLNALASFAGRVFKRYSSIVNPVPLLQYVGDQLRQSNSTDLIVLEQLISSMAGIVTDTNFNDAQVQAMGGGHVLQAQTMLQLLDKRHECKTTSKRLMKSLMDSNLASALLIAIAQERLTCIFKETGAESELKLLGNLFDEIHRVLTQYLDLLQSNLTPEEFASTVPGVASLIGKFGLQPEIAFWISRPSIAHQMLMNNKQTTEAAAKKPDIDPATSKSPDSDVEMAESADPATVKKGEGMAVESGNLNPDEAPADQQETRPNPAIPAKASSETMPWHPVLEEVMESMKSVVPNNLWDTIGLPFYTTFWQLSLHDIYVPQKSYEDELERQKKRVMAISNDRSDVSSAGAQRKEREKKAVNDLHDRILDENKSHLRSYGQTRARLQKEREHWFTGRKAKQEALNAALLQQCFLPRILLSPVDALYCFKLLKYLHSSGTPSFWTLGLLDQFFREHRLPHIIFQCTSKEADNLGRFINEIIRDLNRWHADRAVYEKEAYGVKRDLLGFVKGSTLLDYEDFRRVYYKWHRMLHFALKACLSGGEYMHIRNAISILKAIVQNFPVVTWMGSNIKQAIDDLKTSDPRDDVKIPAASLMGDLNQREKHWVIIQSFVISPNNSSDLGSNSVKIESSMQEKNAPGGPKPAQSRSSTPKLNAAAAEFKPGVAPAKPNGPAGPQANKMEVEDGEIEDAKKGDKQRPDAASPSQPTIDAADVKMVDSGEPEPSNIQDSANEDETSQLKELQSAQPQDDVAQSTQAATPPQQANDEQRPRVPGNNTSQRSRADADTRPQSETPNLPKSQKRPEADRPTTSSPITHPPPNLPNKPETRPFRPEGRLAMRPQDMSDERWDARDARYADQGRPSRYGHDRERPHEYPPIAADMRHGQLADNPRAEALRAEREMAHRPYPEDRPRRPGHPAAPYRDGHEWERSNRGRLGPSDAPPHRQDQPRSTRDEEAFRSSPIHPFSDRSDSVREFPHRHEGARSQREDRRLQGSRPDTPSKLEEGRPSRLDRHDREERKPGGGSHLPSRHEDLPHGPRSDRMSHPNAPDGRGPPESPRDSRMGQQQPSDPTYGRLNQESRFPNRANDSFERPQDIPSGPRRNPSGRAGRGGSTSLPQPPGPPAPQPSDRQPPTGPSGWPGQRTPSHQEPPQNVNKPPSPDPMLGTMDTSGIHPDRLRALQVTADPGYKQSPPSPVSAAPPSGPRGASGAQSAARGPPSGPSFPPGERGRGDKRFAGLNNMLQQSSGPTVERGSQGTMIRGRGANRQSNVSNPPATPNARPQPTEPSGPASGTGRPELFPSRANGSAAPSGPQRQGTDEDPRRAGRTSRRSEAMEDPSQSRRASGVTRTPDEPADRTVDRDRERRGDDDSRRGKEGKRDENRERPRERDRERERERGRGRVDEIAERDEARAPRESPSRRGGPPPSGPVGAEAVPPSRRRERRERDDGNAGNPPDTSMARGGSGRGPSHLPPPPPSLPPHTAPDERRWGGGARAEDRDRTRDRDRDREHIRERDRDRDRERERDTRDRERTRDRDRDRDRRDGGGANAGQSGRGPAAGGGGGGGGGGGPGGTWPRKRGRPPMHPDEGHDQPPTRGGGRGAGGDNKRTRQ